MDHLGNEFVKYATKHHRINDKTSKNNDLLIDVPSSWTDYKIENKTRIAQMFFEKNIDTEFVQVTSLNGTERVGGFGSTGV